MAYDPRMGYDAKRKLSDGDVHDLKPAGWWGDDGMLFREFPFGSYGAGVDFALQVAQLAERQNHHPDIHIFYKRVKLNYFTHDAGGVTGADIEGARAVNALFERAAEPTDGAES